MRMNDLMGDLESGIPGWDDALLPHRRERRFLGRRMHRGDFLPRLAQSLLVPVPTFRRIGLEKHGLGALLFWLTLANVAFFVAWAIRLYLVPLPHVLQAFQIPFGVLVLGALVGRYFFVGWFALAMCALMHILGGRGRNRSCFIALIWADLVTAPISLALALLALAFNYLSYISPVFSADWFTLPLYWLGLISIVYYGAMALAGVHKMPPGRVLLVMSLVTLAGLGLGLYLLLKLN